MKQVKRIAIGTGCALLIYVLTLALTSLLVVRGTVGEEKIGVFVWIFACLSSFAGAKIASLGAGDAVLPAVGAAAAFWAMIQLLGFAASDTLAFSRSLALVLPVLAGAALAYLIRPGRGKRKRGKRSRRSRK